MQVSHNCHPLLLPSRLRRENDIYQTFFAVGHLKGVHRNDRAQRNDVLKLLFKEKSISAAKEDLSDVACECRSVCFPQKCGDREKSFKAGDSVICETLHVQME